jgi:fatty acid-binding protein DegV
MAGTAVEHQASLAIEDGEVVPVKRGPWCAQGVHGVREGVRGRAASTVRPLAGRGSPTPTHPTAERARRSSSAARGRRRGSRSRRTLGAVVGTHAGPGAVGFFWFDDAD